MAILEFKSIPLLGHTLFTWVKVRTPVRYAGPIPEGEACFAYVFEGESQTMGATERVHVRANESILSKCGRYITDLGSKYEEGICSTITVHFHVEVLKTVYQEEVPSFLLSSEIDHPNMFKCPTPALVRHYMEGIRLYFGNEPKLPDEILILKLKEIVLLLLRTHNAPQVLQIMQNLFSRRTAGFREVIETHICSPLDIAELASLTNLSLSAFKRNFRKIYDDTPRHYILNRRIEMVAERLLVADDPIGHIAFQCGFKSAAHLSRAFKARFGMSPSAYVKNRKEEV